MCLSNGTEYVDRKYYNSLTEPLGCQMVSEKDSISSLQWQNGDEFLTY